MQSLSSTRSQKNLADVSEGKHTEADVNKHYKCCCSSSRG